MNELSHYDRFVDVSKELCEGCNVSAATFGCSIKRMENKDKCPCQECLIKASCSKQCTERIIVREMGIGEI